MTTSRGITLEFEGRPSALAFMARALYPKRSESPAPVRAIWRKHRIDRARLEAFLNLTGLRADGGLPLLYPHVFGFRLVMSVLTHPAFPLPIWHALQIRNNLHQHETIAPDAALDFETRAGAHRRLEKGVEIDLHTSVSRGDTTVWESVNTFYYCGHLQGADAPSPLARSPDAGEHVAAAWRTLPPVGWRFGSLTGDYNGIHMWHWYARMFGFRRAFHHPQLILGQCLARLAGSAAEPVQALDTWLKGPVDYDTNVRLCADTGADGTVFALNMDHEPRPAVVGRWRRAERV